MKAVPRPCARSVLLVIRVQYLGRDTAPVGNLHTLLTGPFANCLVLLPVGGGWTCRTTSGWPGRGPLTTTGTACVIDILGECVAKSLRIFLKLANDYDTYPKRLDRWGHTGWMAPLGARRMVQSLTPLARHCDIVIQALPGVQSVEAHGNELVIATDNGSAAISPIAVALNSCEVAVRDLTLRTPTLDDVFLELTGSHIEREDTNEETDR